MSHYAGPPTLGASLRSRPAVLAAAVLVPVLVLVGGVVWWATRSDDPAVEQLLAEVRPEEPRAAGDHRSADLADVGHGFDTTLHGLPLPGTRDGTHFGAEVCRRGGAAGHCR